MQRIAKIALSLLLIFAMFPVLQPVEAAEDWKAHPEKKDVKTDREWKINFSDIATKDKIKDIRVTSGDRNIAVTPTYNKTKTVKVKANHRYLSGSKHTLEIELANGRKDRMSFTTAVENIGTNERIYTGEKIEGNATKSRHYYSIRPTEDGELTIEGSAKGNMTIYLYDREKEKGEFLGFTKEKEDPILRRNLQKNKIYYIAVIADAKYELSTSLSPKSVTKDSALEKAQAEVNALPAPMDVSEKHKYEIDQAKSFIALARLFGAGSLQIEGLEEKIAKLEEVIEPLAIVNTEVLNASTFDIQFNRAVDPELVTIELGEETIDRKYISFNGNRTFATVKMPRTLKEEDSKVSVSLPLMEPLTATLDVEDEKVATLEILGDTAVRVAGDKVSIGYKAFNQYGEEMDNPKVTATAEGNVVNGKPSFEDGRVLIPIDPDKIQEGEEIELTLKDGEKVTETKKTIQVSIKASLYQLNVIGLESDSDSTTLNETTDLNEEDFYLVVKATDQFGGLITNLNELSGDAFSATSTNPSVVTVSDKFEEHDEETGLYKLKLIGNPQDDGTASLPSVGRTSIVLTAHASNQKSKPFAITVGEGQRVDTFTLKKLGGVTAGSDLEIEIQAKDKEGKSITDLEIVKGSVSGVTWTIEPDIPYKVKKMKEDAGGNKEEVKEDEAGQLYLTFEGKDTKEGTLKITGVTSTNQEVTTEIKINEQARPATWEWKSKENEPKYDIVQGNADGSEDKESWNPEVIKVENIIVKDQYGSEMDLPEDYSLQGHTNDRAVEVTNKDGKITITPKAVGSARVTISLYKGNEEVAGSGQEFTFTAKDDTKYVEYELPEIGILYDALAAKKSISKEYAKEVVVYGILENGEAEKVTNFTIEDLPYVYPVDPTLLPDDNSNEEELENKLLIQEALVYRNGPTTKRDLVVTIGSIKEQLTQEIIISKEVPKVEQLEAKYESVTLTKSDLPTPDEKEDFVVDLKWLLNKVELTATDQYGVKSKEIEMKSTDEEDENEISNEEAEISRLEFPDGTKINPTITFDTVKGSQIFENNGKSNAKITNFSAGSVVKSTITANGHSVDVNITMKEKYTPELDEVVEDFNNKLCLEEECESEVGKTVEISEGTKNIEDALKKYIAHKDYDIKVSSVEEIDSTDSETIIENDGRINPVSCKKEECEGKKDIATKVTFTITHKTEPDFEDKVEDQEITFKVPKATEVILAKGSLGKAGSNKITGLTSGKKYKIQVNGENYAVPEDGNFKIDDSHPIDENFEEDTIQELEITEITGLTNGKVYKVEEVVPTKVKVEPNDEKYVGGDGIITGLEQNHRYVVSSPVDKKYFAVQANGELSKEEYSNLDAASEAAEFLNGIEIIGLENGKTYKVEKAKPKVVEGVTATLVDEETVTLSFPQITHANNIDVEMCSGECGKEEDWSNDNVELEKMIVSSSNEAKIINLDLEPDKNYYFRLVIDKDVEEGKEVYEKYSPSTKEPIKVSKIEEIKIEDLVIPKAGESPTSEIKGTKEWKAVINWSPSITKFKANALYTAEIKITPEVGFTLKGFANGNLVITDVEGEEGVKITYKDSIIEVEFPETESEEPDEENE